LKFGEVQQGDNEFLAKVIINEDNNIEYAEIYDKDRDIDENNVKVIFAYCTFGFA